jgi:hypothetical protein
MTRAPWPGVRRINNLRRYKVLLVFAKRKCHEDTLIFKETEKAEVAP